MQMQMRVLIPDRNRVNMPIFACACCESQTRYDRRYVCRKVCGHSQTLATSTGLRQLFIATILESNSGSLELANNDGLDTLISGAFSTTTICPCPSTTIPRRGCTAFSVSFRVTLTKRRYCQDGSRHLPSQSQHPSAKQLRWQDDWRAFTVNWT